MTMVVREATTADMKDVLDYMEKYHETSNLSDIPFKRTSAVKIVEYTIQSRDSLALVAYEEGRLRGILLGTIEPFFFNQDSSYATDIMFISDGAGPQLWKKFIEWAQFFGVKRIMMGVSSGNARAGQLLEALGMTNTGGMYVIRC